ncbi:FtsJ-like methyltransferase [Xylariomycetidae sp. FL0641]|nr:FtsJ-like methyltransferase [Xylariomycetidae sp. FL0641]
MKALLRAVPHGHGRLVRVLPAAAALRPYIDCRASLLARAPVAYVATRWSSSSSRYVQRQNNDIYQREAKTQGFKSRAAFKLLELDSKYKLFRKGQTVVDLGYAPGSWSQVAVSRTRPGGRVIGVDIIPTQPPRGVSAIQGNFLSPGVQNLVKEYLHEFAAHRKPTAPASETSEDEETFFTERPSYIAAERAESVESDQDVDHVNEGKLVDLVLSDMSEPWPQTSGFNSRSLSKPYLSDPIRRLMNTSGTPIRDHSGSMDLCLAALQFASDTLRTGGHFVCKFYQGPEDKSLELKLKKMFERVHRGKPDSSRSPT